jgi:hypothetical protein
MSHPDDSAIELEPADRALAQQLEAIQPLPSPAFRGALGRRLIAIDPGYGPRPASLRRTAALLITAGMLLLLLGALVGSGLV